MGSFGIELGGAVATPAGLAALAGGLALTGAVAGILAGLLGVGGGIVIVPVLFWLFGLLEFPQSVSMHVAVATSLATIIPTSLSSARAHHTRGALDMGLLRLWAPYIFTGALMGGVVSKFLDSAQLTALFGVVAFAMAVNLAIPRPSSTPPMEKLPRTGVVRAGLGGGIGFVSALMGIGGGALSVPALTVFGVPVHRAIGVAAAFGFVIAVPGTAGFIWSGLGVAGRPPLSAGYVNLPAAIVIFSVSVFTAPVGARIAHKVNARTLRLAFAAFLAVTALRMIAKLFIG